MSSDSWGGWHDGREGGELFGLGETAVFLQFFKDMPDLQQPGKVITRARKSCSRACLRCCRGPKPSPTSRFLREVLRRLDCDNAQCPRRHRRRRRQNPRAAPARRRTPGSRSTRELFIVRPGGRLCIEDEALLYYTSIRWRFLLLTCYRNCSNIEVKKCSIDRRMSPTPQKNRHSTRPCQPCAQVRGTRIAPRPTGSSSNICE